MFSKLIDWLYLFVMLGLCGFTNYSLYMSFVASGANIFSPEFILGMMTVVSLIFWVIMLTHALWGVFFKRR